MDSYIFSFLYKLIIFSLPLSPVIHRMGNTSNIMRRKCKEQKYSQPCFIFYYKLSKITLDYVSELINLKYAFNIPFEIFLQTVIMGTSQFHDGVQLNILPTLSLLDTASELDSEETFVKAWSSLLNNKGNLFN